MTLADKIEQRIKHIVTSPQQQELEDLLTAKLICLIALEAADVAKDHYVGNGR